MYYIYYICSNIRHLKYGFLVEQVADYVVWPGTWSLGLVCGPLMDDLLSVVATLVKTPFVKQT